MHSKGFIHCDIKPDNILLNSRLEAKIGDLGITKITGAKKSMVQEGVGPVAYLPREFFMEKYNNSVDIYSYGFVLNELFAGEKHLTDPFKMKKTLTKKSKYFFHII